MINTQTQRDVEAAVRQIGKDLLSGGRARRSWWNRLTQEDILLDRLMNDEAIRVASLRFVDVLPALDDDDNLCRHLEEYFGDKDLHLPWPALAHWGLRHARRGIAPHVIAPMVRAVAGRMARRFIAGHNAATAARTLARLHRNGMGFTIDLLGEAVVCESESEHYQGLYLKVLRELDPIVRRFRSKSATDAINGRVSPRLNLSVKISAMFSQIDPVDPAGSTEAIKARLRPILLEAKKRGAFITLDMEQYDTKDITLRAFREILMEDGLRDWPDVGLAMQAYLRDTPRDIDAMITWVKERGTPVTVRLVRGAYWDYETVIAQQNDWEAPVWMHKGETDLCYETCLAKLFAAHPSIETAAATHNVRSLALTIALAKEHGLATDQYEMQMLYGMADELKQKLVQSGQRLRVYLPFGELLPGMAYLVRRLLENTGSQSFVRMGAQENVAPEVLLAPPDVRSIPQPKPRKPGFVNESNHRWTDRRERDQMDASLAQVRSELGGKFPLIVGGRDVATTRELRSVNPANPSQIIGATASAEPADAHRAIDAAEAALTKWRHTSIAERNEILRRGARLMRERRDQFAALQMLEAGKPRREADADVTEAIDFIEYYAHEAERLSGGHKLHVPGETNDYFYEPRGVGAVITPWNFPLAIPVGMCIAPIAAGNTIVFKPAPQTPIIAAKFAKLMHEAGLPAGVLNYLPGDDEAGKALVAHPKISFISFTGSQSAGVSINQSAAKLADGQETVKHVVAELGGKNALIVDDDADPDDAVLGVVRSAFGFAGQKCSACSRVIVIGAGYDAFVKRLCEAAASLKIGDPVDPATFLGPVIDAEAYERINRTIDEAGRRHMLALRTDVSHLKNGYYIGPTIFRDVDPASDLARNEIFGPVLAVMRAKNFDHALQIANSSRYALTGGLYSRSPHHLARARREFRVGNLYLNRKITGAIVNRQPFGGFKLSGTNAKAGGPDYLMHFLEARCVTENTLRRGFAPSEED